MFSFDYKFSTVLGYTPLGGWNLAHFFVYLPIPDLPPYVVKPLHIHGVQPSALHLCSPFSSWSFVSPLYSISILFSSPLLRSLENPIPATEMYMGYHALVHSMTSEKIHSMSFIPPRDKRYDP